MLAKVALCIGINDYPGTDSDLNGCVNDASDWGQLFEARGFSVRQLLNSAATGNAMRSEIARAIDSVSPGGTVVIQYSGHGSYVPDDNGDADESDGTDECFCPHDLLENGPIRDDELDEIFSRRTDGVRVVLVADSCHSGTVARFAPITTPPTTAGITSPARKVRFLPPATFLSSADVSKLGIATRRAASAPGRYHSLLLAGCRDVEYSYDAWFEGRPNGAFTFVALRDLRTNPNLQNYQEWYALLRKSLPSQQYPQAPQLYGTRTMKHWPIFS